MNKTKEEINAALCKFKSCVKKGLIELKYERKKNNDFISNYQLRSSKIRKLLLSIKGDEFNRCEKGLNPEFMNRELWSFLIKRVLYSREDEKKEVIIYIKWCFNSDKSIVISFHQASYPN